MPLQQCKADKGWFPVFAQNILKYSRIAIFTFTNGPVRCDMLTWGVEVLRYPNFLSGMEADRNVEVVGGDVAVL